MNIVAIVQARLGSKRLPEKVLKEVNGMSLIEMLIKRLSKSKKISKIILATSNSIENEKLIKHVKNLNIDIYAGSEANVLERYFEAANIYKADVIVRITGDCPLVDAAMVDECISIFHNKKVDYLCNNYPPTFPDGLDIEVFTKKSLDTAFMNASKEFDKEHVTPYIRDSNEFLKYTYSYEKDFSGSRWTVDESEDYEVIQNICNYFHPSIHFSWKEVLQLEESNPNLFTFNKNIIRNEGASMSDNQKLWKRAKKTIPGGTMLLSKRPEMFLPDAWPSYYSKAHGCYVWDIEGNKYTDMSLMGVGTNILGYGNEQVDNAVRETISNGNMSTLNCPEEVYLAEKLIEMHPWADKVRFARSGGEANAVAIRIARCASGKDNVAICGYHGWHDWYLAANLSDDNNLDGHLLSGLNPKGVPSHLNGTVFPFDYNNLEQLKNLINTKNIGTIKMEVMRNFEPEDGFLHKVRELATKNNIVLIFDECTSGFRETFGGLHKKFNVNPDIAMFGKALGNGYAITSIIGIESVMDAAQESFISSTFWTERIGPSAALKTLEVMSELKSWDKVTLKGKKVMLGWSKLKSKYELDILISGLPALATFSFGGKDSLSYKTYLTQEMLKRGYLASTSCYSCVSHTDEIIEEYLDNLDPIFQTIKKCELGELDIGNLLEGPVCHSGFQRLN